jgi:hypothetical protein
MTLILGQRVYHVIRVIRHHRWPNGPPVGHDTDTMWHDTVGHGQRRREGGLREARHPPMLC